MEILTNAVTFNEFDIYTAISEARSVIEDLDSGRIKKVKNAFDDYLNELKDEAVRLNVCPICGDNLKWRLMGSVKGNKLISYVQCVACDFKEVCQ